MKTIKTYCTTQLREDIILKKNKKNTFQSPILKKIGLNIGVKEANSNANKILPAIVTLFLITGQIPTITKAHKSIANFKLRKNKIIGCKTTLRNSQMYNFLEKFIHVVLPQIIENKPCLYKNRQLTNHITLGIKDCNIFPELENQYNLLSSIHGLNIDLCLKEYELNKKNLFFSGLKIKFH
jgi:large subunit ribosomal protein L5